MTADVFSALKFFLGHSFFDIGLLRMEELALLFSPTDQTPELIVT